MEITPEFLNKRSSPGLLLFDFQGKLLFFNQKSQELIVDLNVLSGRLLEKDSPWPKPIWELYVDLKELGEKEAKESETKELSLSKWSGDGFPHYLRGILIKPVQRINLFSYILMLVEPVRKKRYLPFEQLKVKFNLTKRELEVIQLLCEGLPNKEISERLFVSEHTVKDHLKNIMGKLGVSSRNKIMATLVSRTFQVQLWLGFHLFYQSFLN
jgi:DNA-binding CsgD family transcriptional regulator